MIWPWAASNMYKGSATTISLLSTKFSFIRLIDNDFATHAPDAASCDKGGGQLRQNDWKQSCEITLMPDIWSM